MKLFSSLNFRSRGWLPVTGVKSVMLRTVIICLCFAWLLLGFKAYSLICVVFQWVMPEPRKNSLELDKNASTINKIRRIYHIGFFVVYP